MPWATVWENTYLPLKLKGVSRSEAAPAIEEALQRVNLLNSQRAIRANSPRHEDACLHRPRAGDAAENPADGRTLRRARRDHALPPQQ